MKGDLTTGHGEAADASFSLPAENQLPEIDFTDFAANGVFNVASVLSKHLTY